MGNHIWILLAVVTMVNLDKIFSTPKPPDCIFYRRLGKLVCGLKSCDAFAAHETYSVFTALPAGRYKIGKYDEASGSFKLYKSVTDSHRYGGRGHWDNLFVPEDGCHGDYEITSLGHVTSPYDRSITVTDANCYVDNIVATLIYNAPQQFKVKMCPKYHECVYDLCNGKEEKDLQSVGELLSI